MRHLLILIIVGWVLWHLGQPQGSSMLYDLFGDLK